MKNPAIRPAREYGFHTWSVVTHQPSRSKCISANSRPLLASRKNRSRSGHALSVVAVRRSPAHPQVFLYGMLRGSGSAVIVTVSPVWGSVSVPMWLVMFFYRLEVGFEVVGGFDLRIRIGFAYLWYWFGVAVEADSEFK